ncbi:hypothetical protein D9757_002744 [Collybiopsis confluens]|uniref:Uncharacterized protein n=1 Tax=Collybiopsis confluens TaxID=2823264 RepID=A0A8H5HW67_9AGAR|nr:hypothetical protein D9757_002744 [Collybiopsis confluens]
MSSHPTSPVAKPQTRYTEPLRASPGSTLSGSPPLNTSLHSLTREASRTSLRSMLAGSMSTPNGRKPAIRVDPSMLTCFDAADRELYDLWVPKK